MNKQMTDTQNEIERKMKLIIKEDEVDSVEDLGQPPMQMMIATKSAGAVLQRPETTEIKQKEEDDTFYFPMSSGRSSRPRSVSAADPPSYLKRTESAPIVCNDDKGTDYWISYVFMSALYYVMIMFI